MFYTVGHSNYSIDEFISTLRKFSIEVVVDIRRFPKSKHEQFDRENLKKSLEEAGIKYVWIEKLGGYRGNYRKYMETKEFEEGITELLKYADKRVAIMCAERNYLRCHRRFVSEHLERLGFEVYHIVGGVAFRHRRISDFKL